MINYRVMKAELDKRVRQLRQEIEREQEIADITNDPLLVTACYERMSELEAEIEQISDHLFYLKLQYQDSVPPKQ